MYSVEVWENEIIGGYVVQVKVIEKDLVIGFCIGYNILVGDLYGQFKIFFDLVSCIFVVLKKNCYFQIYIDFLLKWYIEKLKFYFFEQGIIVVQKFFDREIILNYMFCVMVIDNGNLFWYGEILVSNFIGLICCQNVGQ